MKKKIIFLDIDGTLYSPEINQIPAKTLVAIKKARENGHQVFLATGRSRGESLAHLDLAVDGFIFSSGAQVIIKQKLIANEQMPQEDIQFFANLCNKYQVGYTICSDIGAYMNDHSIEYVRNYFKGTETDAKIIDAEVRKNGFFPLTEMKSLANVAKMSVMCSSKKQGDEIISQILPAYSCKYTFVDPQETSFILEIVNKEINKAEGIKKVLANLNLSLKDTIAFGDSSNDVEMLKMCEIGIAMGNGSADSKQAANEVCANILDDGIYHSFVKYNLI